MLCCFVTGRGCGPREPHVPYNVAAKWHAAMTLEVLYSWDLMKYQVNTAPLVTHLIKVKVLQGPPEVAIGQEMILPYSDWPPKRSRRGD